MNVFHNIGKTVRGMQLARLPLHNYFCGFRTAIVLLGEPKCWETPLQLLVDLLRTDGKPDKPVDVVSDVPQLPVIACNMDLQFMERACIPRLVVTELLTKALDSVTNVYKIRVSLKLRAVF